MPQLLHFATVNASRQLNWYPEKYMANIISVDLDIVKEIDAILNVCSLMKEGIIYVNKLWVIANIGLTK